MGPRPLFVSLAWCCCWCCFIKPSSHYSFFVSIACFHHATSSPHRVLAGLSWTRGGARCRAILGAFPAAKLKVALYNNQTAIRSAAPRALRKVPSTRLFIVEDLRRAVGTCLRRRAALTRGAALERAHVETIGSSLTAAEDINEDGTLKPNLALPWTMRTRNAHAQTRCRLRDKSAAPRVRKSSVVALDELLNFTGEAYDLETELVLEGFRVRLARDVPLETMPVNQRVQTR